MTARGATRKAFILCAGAVALSLSGCGPVEYHGYEAEIDGVLWRQIAGFEDPMTFYASPTQTPTSYLADLDAERWDGTVETLPDLKMGGVVLYNLSALGRAATFSVFIASGPRSDVPTDEGGTYTGPSQVYTCYSMEVEFGGAEPAVQRIILAKCPADLVQHLPEDSAFASGEVFDG